MTPNEKIAALAERLDALERAVVLAAFRQAQTRYELQQLGVLPVPLRDPVVPETK